MTPYGQAQLVHARSSAVPFLEYVEHHLKNGYVVSTPKFFWMAITTRHDQLAQGANPYDIRAKNPDCWYLSLLAGDMALAWLYEPFPLTYYAFHRERGLRKRLSIWPRHRLRARTTWADPVSSPSL